MPAETVTRRWTVATWLVAGAGDHLDAVANALRSVRADAVALQSIRRDDADAVARALEQRVEWELSHYPNTPLFQRSGVGLCVISPHRLADSRVVPTERRSRWSRRRRIVQSVTVLRSDHSEYRIVHRVGPVGVLGGEDDAGNSITITPEQVGVDAVRAIGIPDAATLVAAQVERPIATVAPLQSTTFEMPWVQGDFPV